MNHIEASIVILSNEKSLKTSLLNFSPLIPLHSRAIVYKTKKKKKRKEKREGIGNAKEMTQGLEEPRIVFLRI